MSNDTGLIKQALEAGAKLDAVFCTKYAPVLKGYLGERVFPENIFQDPMYPTRRSGGERVYTRRLCSALIKACQLDYPEVVSFLLAEKAPLKQLHKLLTPILHYISRTTEYLQYQLDHPSTNHCSCAIFGCCSAFDPRWSRWIDTLGSSRIQYGSQLITKLSYIRD